MPCIFCGSPERSQEHVIARRWDGPLRASQATTPGTAAGPLTNRWTPPADSPLEGWEWSTPKPGLVTNDVCPPCNNEWLNAIDDEVETLFKDMIIGRAVTLTSKDQKAIALWTFKTILLMQRVRPDEARLDFGPRASELRTHGHPPTDVRISLGATQGGSAVHEASTEASLTTVTSTEPGFLAILTMGNLLTVTGGRLTPRPTPLRFDAAPDRRILVPIWPASLRSTSWPPPTVVEDLQPGSIAELLGAAAHR